MPQSGSGGSQPFRGDPERRHRRYIPATWAPPGEGGGAPKQSGGYEVDNHGVPIPTRGLNRADQRYSQPRETIIANRLARATAEYGTAAIALGAGGVVEVRSASGNCYEVGPGSPPCNCPDLYKLRLSYEGDVYCKHILMVDIAIAEYGSLAQLPWGTPRIAEEIGCAQATAETLCRLGRVPAVRVNSMWVAEQTDALRAAIALYKSRVLGGIPVIPGVTP